MARYRVDDADDVESALTAAAEHCQKQEKRIKELEERVEELEKELEDAQKEIKDLNDSRQTP